MINEGDVEGGKTKDH